MYIATFIFFFLSTSRKQAIKVAVSLLLNTKQSFHTTGTPDPLFSSDSINENMNPSTSASSSLFRRPSLRSGDSSFLDAADAPRPPRRRFSSMFGNSSPPSLAQVPQQTRPRARSYKYDRVTMESGDSALSHRTSFIDFGDESPKRRDLESKVFGSLRGRLSKKNSAPLLNHITYTPTLPPLDSSSNEQGTPQSPAVKRSLSGYHLRNSTSSSSLDFSLRSSLSFKDYRKKTLTPEEIVNGVGYINRIHEHTEGPETDKDEDMTSHRGQFQALPFRKKGCMILHRYPREDAPYMSSYNKVDLQNDIYFHRLLRRLNTTGSPSFHQYGAPPLHVLDLGCGQGTWAREAATAWAEAGTKVVGFDLVDLISSKSKSLPNLSFQRGNFVAFPLPFSDDTFDLVRLSNLTEAIPQHRWEHVLLEIRRVLMPFGRIEIIDDEIMFPYPAREAKRPRQVSSSSSIKSSMTVRSNLSGEEEPHTPSCGPVISINSSENDELHSDVQEMESSFLDLDLDGDRRSIESAPGLCNDDSPSEESCDNLLTPTDYTSIASVSDRDSVSETASNRLSTMSQCQEVEKIFEDMLEGSYGVDAHPNRFLERLLRRIFGPVGKPRKINDFRLGLLNPIIHELYITLKNMGYHNRENLKRGKLFKEPKLKREDLAKIINDKLSMYEAKVHGRKAVKFLGQNNLLPYDAIARSSEDSGISRSGSMRSGLRPRTASSVSTVPSTSSQRSDTPVSSTSSENQTPTGLFLFPDQFLETTPLELERYLCKHMDSLLGCKAALDDYVLHPRAEGGEELDPVFEENKWMEMLWEYERSRRERFNLPDVSSYFEESDDEDSSSLDPLRDSVKAAQPVVDLLASAIVTRCNMDSTPRRASTKSDRFESCTLVRHIRVYEAYK